MILRLGFWGCLSLLMGGMLLRVGVGNAGLLSTDIVVPLFVLVWLGIRILIDRRLKSSKLLLTGGAFLLFAALTFWWGAWNLDLKAQIHSFAYIIRFASMLLFGWSAKDLFRTEKDKQQLMLGMTIIALVIVVLGFLQFYLIPDISEWSEEGKWDPHTGRLLGSWMDPNFMAGFLAFWIPMTMGFWYRSKLTWQRILYALVIPVYAYAIFLTFSRSGYLSAAIGIGFFCLLRARIWIVVGILILTLGVASNERAQKRLGELAGTLSSVILMNTDEVDPTANLRIQSWQRSLELFYKYPVAGIGYNTYRYRAAEEGVVREDFYSSGGSDSTLLTVLVTTGVVGLLFFFVFLVQLWVPNFYRYVQTRDELFLGFCAGFLALMAHSMFVNSLLFPLIFLPVIAFAMMLENESSS